MITRVLLEDDFPRRGIGVTAVDMTDLAAVEAAITPATKVLFFETATNPRLRVADIDALAALGHRHGLIVVADNTFLAPALLRPIEHGADLVVHAATKWLSGHGDAVSGAVSGPQALLDPIRKQVDTLGQAASPFASWLVLRGVRSLPLRSRTASANALQIAEFLERQPNGRVGALPGPRLAPRPRGCRAPDRRAGRRDAHVPAPRRHRRHGRLHRPPRACATSASASATSARSCIRSPKQGGMVRVSVGCEDVEDLLEDFALGLSFVA